MEEKWVWVKGFEGLYQISNTGKIKSFLRVEEGYELSNQNSNGNYLPIILRNTKENKKRYSHIHVLVAEHFIGDIPSGWHVHHKDGNKLNNNVENLEIIHPKAHRVETEKMNPRVLSGLVYYNQYEKPKHILQYDLNGNFIAEYANCKIASKLTGVCQRNILQVANNTEYRPGKTRSQAGGYIWKTKEVV